MFVSYHINAHVQAESHEKERVLHNVTEKTEHRRYKRQPDTMLGSFFTTQNQESLVRNRNTQSDKLLKVWPHFCCVFCIVADWLFSSYGSCHGIKCHGGGVYHSVCWSQTADETYWVRLKPELFISAQSRRLSIMLTRRKNYQRLIPSWEKQCIRFSKRCRYQHFWIAWPGPAFPLTYLSSQELASGKKWWKRCSIFKCIPA